MLAIYKIILLVYIVHNLNAQSVSNPPKELEPKGLTTESELLTKAIKLKKDLKDLDRKLKIENGKKISLHKSTCDTRLKSINIDIQALAKKIQKVNLSIMLQEQKVNNFVKIKSNGKFAANHLEYTRRMHDKSVKQLEGSKIELDILNDLLKISLKFKNDFIKLNSWLNK